ncbi:phosphatase PAP2 family protein [Acinetobacter sp. WZC-1]|uniref:phosphatase PAP2 family protein n=1 Tax=Acinetobacter sp. WZC-1 TaxID=3459034 RepID=UPI00403DFF5F
MILLFLLVPVLCILGWELIHHYYEINTPLFLLINGMPPHNDWLWQNISFLGDGLPAYVLLIFFCRKNAHLLWLGILAFLVTGLAVQGIKYLIDVVRPISYLGIENVHVIGKALKFNSFPSGHAATAFVLAGVLSRSMRQNAFAHTRLISTGLILFATLIALSRVVVGVHWPLDVIIGAIWGWYSAAILMRLSARTVSIGRTRRSANILYILAAISAGCLWNFDGGYPLAAGLAKLLSACAMTYVALSLVELNLRVRLILEKGLRLRLRPITAQQLDHTFFEKSK